MLTDFSGSVPSTPLGFEVQPNPQVPAQFEIISVNVSQPSSPEDGISAFIFRVQHAEDTFYVLQVFSIRKKDSCLPTFTIALFHNTRNKGVDDRLLFFLTYSLV